MAEKQRPLHKRDGDELLGFLIPFAQQCLAKHGEFHPFAACVTAGGKVEAISAEPADVETFVRALTAGARDKRYRATGLCQNMRITDPRSRQETDAIVVSFDHAQGEAIDCIVPYKKAKRGYEYGELLATRGETRIFGRR